MHRNIVKVVFLMLYGTDLFQLIGQPMVDFASLLEIPLFNELMLVYEIQYNATKDALKHFLEEQVSFDSKQP